MTAASKAVSCDDLWESGRAEDYLLGRLDDEAATAVEAHYFDCARCLEELDTLRAARAVLAGPEPFAIAGSVPPRRLWRYAGLAAAVLVGGLSLRLGLGPSSPPLPAPSPPAPEAPGHTGPTATARPDPPLLAGPDVAQLARLTPPAAPTGTLRGTSGRPKGFAEAMRHYAAGDYAGTAKGLENLATDFPEALDVRFFLAISRLLAGQPRAAVPGLEAVVAEGDTPYLEEARFYLAQAALLNGDAGTATAHLRAVTTLEGDLETVARQQLSRIEGVLRTEPSAVSANP